MKKIVRKREETRDNLPPDVQRRIDEARLRSQERHEQVDKDTRDAVDRSKYNPFSGTIDAYNKKRRKQKYG